MTGFDNNLYIEAQKTYIEKLLSSPSEIWCIEVGGKLIQDRHAARVLPGFNEDVRFEFVKQMSESCDVVMVVSAKDIVKKRIRGDFKTTYDDETFRSIQELSSRGMKIQHVAISRMSDVIRNDFHATRFLERLQEAGIKYSVHNEIEGYSAELLTDEDLENAPQISVTKKQILVISPGGGSGKFGICLTLLFQAMRAGKAPHYFSIGAFPIYELPATHPLNIAYLAATADFSDELMVDPKNSKLVLPARELHNFKLLQKVSSFFPQYSKHLLAIESAAEMCINFLQKGIIDYDVVRKEAAAEVARRYMRYKIEAENNQEHQDTVQRVRKLFKLL